MSDSNIDDFPTQFVYYDKEMRNLCTAFKQCYAILDKISRRRERAETIQVSTSIFDYRIVDSLKCVHPNRFFNFTFGDLTLTAYRTQTGLYGLKLMGDTPCPPKFHDEFPDTGIKSYISNDNVRDYDSLYDLFLNAIQVVITQNIKHELL